MGHKREPGKFGLRIKSYQAGSVYEVMNGCRDNYDSKDAMLTNSLFLNFLKENGLRYDEKRGTTRDIICIQFGYGSRSYEQEVSHLNKQIDKVNNNSSIDEDKKAELIERYEYYLEKAEENKDAFIKKSADDVRVEFYNKGIEIQYPTWNKDGEIKSIQTIKYVMLYRTPGKAKKGECLFCRRGLYKKAINYLRMGIKLPKKNAPIVEIGAYSSLITSTIDITLGDEGRIKIAPEEILILKDVDTFFNTRVISIETNDKKQCVAKEIDDYPVQSTLFDGQALIDMSIVPEGTNGYLLLRQHFTKCAAFCTYIQKFFRDHYGDGYEDAYIEDMFGRQVRVKDIKLVTTDNATKWLKFGVDFDYWADWIRKEENYWGIVKTAHKSKYGERQRMSYQMVNALNLDDMEDVCRENVDYITLLKQDNKAFRQYLKENENFSNDYEVLGALVDQDEDFYRCDYFRQRKWKILQGYVKNVKTGKLLQSAENLVIGGNLYGMLMYAVGEDPLLDPTFSIEDDAIQCWTNRFKDGEYLAEFRNPFNSLNNLGYLHNVYDDRFDEYFELSDLCVVVNMNGTDFQSRNNGSDQDSDSIYTTNLPSIVKHAKHCYANYPTTVNNVPQEKNIYSSSLNDFAAVDNRLASSQMSIGMSSNLAQVALSYTFNFDDKKYNDCVCILAVVAQICIDSAKKNYDIDLVDEINRLRRIMDVTKNGYPKFWLGIRKGFNKNRINPSLRCPMNYLFNLNLGIMSRSPDPDIPIDNFFVYYPIDDNTRRSKRVEQLIGDYSLKVHQITRNDVDLDGEVERYLLMRDDFDELIEDLKKVYIGKNYRGLMSWLINRAFLVGSGAKSKKEFVDKRVMKNRALLLRVLYEINPKCLLSCFKNGKK